MDTKHLPLWLPIRSITFLLVILPFTYQKEMQETAKTETNKLGKNPVWTAERCALCLGCLHRCPKFAISYNNKTQSHGQYQHSKYYKKSLNADRKEVDKAFADLKKEGAIVSPVRCKWTVA